MADLANLTGTWWSYAQTDSTLVGVVVAALAIAGVAFVGTRLLARRRR